jgi:hypothetical protein
MMLSPRRSTAAVVLLTGACVGASLVAVPSVASAACATKTTRAISGIISGGDNRDVNVSIGFDVQDAKGTFIKVADGCKKGAGYSAPQQEKNHYVGGEGALRNSRMHDAQGNDKGVTTHTWRLGSLPSNASSVWIEVYSRAYTGSPCTTCFGAKDVHKYGYVMRRKVKVGSTGVNLRLPLTCSFPGGSTGIITGTVKNRAGQVLTPSRAMAWSVLPDSNTTPMGWGSGSLASGRYKVESLASAQKYSVWVTYNGVTQKRTGVPDNRCKTTPLNFVF